MHIRDKSFKGLPPWCGGLKGYTLQAGDVTRIQPHWPGSNPAWARKLDCLKNKTNWCVAAKVLQVEVNVLPTSTTRLEMTYYTIIETCEV